MTSDAVFIGTDASENWQVEEFKAYAKPHFDKGKAWNFKAVERQIYVNDEGDYAWFDELLDTQMKLCRGSGVLKKESGDWKIAHYVLSLVIPNENVSEVILIKQEKDDRIIEELIKQ
ncbi:MAG: nuclear transport factor 2 family protein [Arenibacter algicola]